jgi:cytochrome o ubiquinol oxidase subunit IV
MSHKSLSARIIGYTASLIFTLTAFFMILRPDFFHSNTQIAIIVIFVLALLQASTQAICFLNVIGEKGPRWNLVIFISTLSMILIIVIGTMWIMHHLNYRMMWM